MCLILLIKPVNAQDKDHSVTSCHWFNRPRSRGEAVTQKQFAKEIGVTHRTLQDWLNEQSTPKSASAVLRLMCTVPDRDERLRLLEVWLGEPTQFEKR